MSGHKSHHRLGFQLALRHRTSSALQNRADQRRSHTRPAASSPPQKLKKAPCCYTELYKTTSPMLLHLRLSAETLTASAGRQSIPSCSSTNPASPAYPGCCSPSSRGRSGESCWGLGVRGCGGFWGCGAGESWATRAPRREENVPVLLRCQLEARQF